MKHILIDVDGVLIKSNYKDDFGKHYYWQKDMEKDFGISPKDWSKLFDEDFKSVIIGKANLEDKVDAFLRANHPYISGKEIISYWLRKDSNLNENILPWIQKMRSLGYKFHIASNQAAARARYLQTIFKDIIDSSEPQFYSYALKTIKQNPDFFLKTLETLKTTPNQVWLIDDDNKNIEVAKEIGINAILFDINDSEMIDKLEKFFN